MARGPLLLCLDFDGTLSEIVPHPADARPLSGVGEVLSALVRDPARIRVAIISGREIAEVRRMLGVERGIWFAGTHGLEIVGADGVSRLATGVEAAQADLAAARAWLARNIATSDGFVIEDKRVAIAVHYRMVDPTLARERCAALRDFVEAKTPALRVLRGKMIDELLPRGIGGKGSAIRALLQEAAYPKYVPVYFGDDTTDEDAFQQIRDDGIGVLVGSARPSWARYRVDSPSEVRRVLAELAQELLHTIKAPSR
ncbi:MAG: trehalose-phosphatase [Deltaproteobacteria bacterium]|nr:trehalose-phosphatase [Deltaproteobacteria bacterium]